MNNTFNFKQVLDHPITLYRFGKFVLPFGIGLARLVLFVLILIVMLIFHRYINALMPFSSGYIIIYGGIPYLLSHILLKFRKDGKKIHYFIIDFLRYFFSIYLRKKRYCNDQEVLYLNDKATFEPLYMKKGGCQDEVENANASNIQKLNVDRRRRDMGILSDNARSNSSV